MWDRPLAIRPVAYMAIFACCLSACAVIYADSDGSQRIVGLADVEITPAGRSRSLTGDIVTVRTVGLTLSTLEANEDFSVGYYRKTIALLRNCGPASVPDCSPRDFLEETAAFDRGFANERVLPRNGKGFLGLVNVTIPPPETAPARAGTLTNFEVVGLSFARHPQGLDVIVGYSRSGLLAIGDNVVVQFVPDEDDCRLLELILALGAC